MNRQLVKSAACLLVLALAGCTGDFYDSRARGYIPQMPEQAYPINVAKGAVKLELPLNSARLDMKERGAVLRLGRDAMLHAVPIIVERPKGSVKGEVKAAEITRVLVDEAGIPARRVRHVVGSSAGRVLVRYERKFAITRECGDWSAPVNETADNSVYPNFGCAQQHNIAAMVDNPEDFERPRVMSGADVDARNKAIELYRKREDYSSTWPGGSKIRIDDGLKASINK